MTIPVRRCPLHDEPVRYASSHPGGAALCKDCIRALAARLVDGETVDRAAIRARLAAIREGRL